MKSESVYIVLTKTTTILSRLISGITGSTYTHASIALDRELSTMYSFGRKQRYNPLWGGFCCEDINDGLFSDCTVLPFAIIEIKVTPKQYQEVATLIQSYKEDAALYHYNYLGLIWAGVGKVSKHEYRYYCSEFVYTLLLKSKIIIAEEQSIAVHPQDLLQYGKVIKQGDWLSLAASSEFSLPF